MSLIEHSFEVMVATRVASPSFAITLLKKKMILSLALSLYGSL